MRNLFVCWKKMLCLRQNGDVNFKIDERTGRVVMMGALDNLVKGAAGQAVQNMNLLFGLDESEGLNLVPMFP